MALCWSKLKNLFHAGTSRYPWLYPDVTSFQLWQLEYTLDDSIKQLVNRVALEYGKIDFLYLNAGRQYVGTIQLTNPSDPAHADCFIQDAS